MLLILSGYSATGKDTYQNMLLETHPELKRALSATTRPIRPGEVNAREYLFVDDDGYRWYAEDGNILSQRIYQTIQNGEPATWYYGLLRQDFRNEDWIAVLDHEGARRVRGLVGPDQVKIVYITCPDTELVRRSIARRDEQAEFTRRLADDKIKFEGIREIADLEMNSMGSMSTHILNIEEIGKLLENENLPII